MASQQSRLSCVTLPLANAVQAGACKTLECSVSSVAVLSVSSCPVSSCRHTAAKAAAAVMQPDTAASRSAVPAPAAA